MDLRTYGWESAIKCEFNPEASMLMVSGSLNTDMTGRAKGEIMVFTIDKKLRICARISNRPSDATGCWYGNKFVISSEFKWLNFNHHVIGEQGKLIFCQDFHIQEVEKLILRNFKRS